VSFRFVEWVFANRILIGREDVPGGVGQALIGVSRLAGVVSRTDGEPVCTSVEIVIAASGVDATEQITVLRKEPHPAVAKSVLGGAVESAKDDDFTCVVLVEDNLRPREVSVLIRTSNI